MLTPSPRVQLRLMIAVLLIVQGVVHLRMYDAGFSGLPTVGPMFLAGAWAAFVLAAAIAVSGHPLVAGPALLLAVGQLGALGMAKTVGLFGFETTLALDDFELAAVMSEALAAVALVALLRWRGRVVEPRARPQLGRA